ncbi:OadG family protein [bacterium]|nr:OadG family protein [bacterium]HPF36364.1 OadG family protein [Candidatus Krumholzibacteria bacterium]HRX52236.1 OadG family protein [Candidatus Krumholzibacteria bacterium]
MPETIQQNLPLALVGLLIVFAVLSVIALVISLIRQLDEKWRHQEKIQTAQALDREPTVDNTTLVLVAAAAATVLRGRYRITSIRRLMPTDHKRSPWTAQGRSQLQGSHVVERKR